MSPAAPTDQRRVYEAAYQNADGAYGIPDRKIADGRPLVGQQILCLGCGAGNDIWHLAADNQVIGFDYANSGLEVAERHDIAAVYGDLNLDPKLPFADAAFDVVICKDILEHLLDPLAVLRDVRRVLKQGGFAVVSVPNHFTLPMRLRLLCGRGLIYRSLLGGHEAYDEWNYMHVRFFTYRGFRRFLRAAGFRAEKWFWDFGNLAHYRNPDMWLEPQLWKRQHGLPLSPRAKLGVYIIRPLWAAFNAVFPRYVRRAIVAQAPGLLCGGFYVRVVKEE
ncbi:MAG: class I SAM-dependent methyltransferase [Acidobacteriia bacterium]|nr:class I SAM-dependent methyltransferase [Terriglobia bacterium]